jgi:hypothetical protein
MTLLSDTDVRDVHGLPDIDKALIRSFMQGAIYSWVKNQEDKQFSVRDLVGGVNFEWAGTPLYALYKKHVAAGKVGDDATEAAGKDLGWIVKSVLADDKRTFESGKSGLVKCYKWIGNEP